MHAYSGYAYYGDAYYGYAYSGYAYYGDAYLVEAAVLGQCQQEEDGLVLRGAYLPSSVVP